MGMLRAPTPPPAPATLPEVLPMGQNWGPLCLRGATSHTCLHPCLAAQNPIKQTLGPALTRLLHIPDILLLTEEGVRARPSPSPLGAPSRVPQA